MGRFIKLPVEIEAVQFTGEIDQRTELQTWIETRGGTATNWFFNGSDYVSFNILTLEGPMVASKGDWIIQGIQGELYPCKPDIFASTYTEACTCMPPTFEQELVSLINRHSMENFSGTPDWILANYLNGVLRQFDCAVKARADWRGESVELPALMRLDTEKVTEDSDE